MPRRPPSPVLLPRELARRLYPNTPEAAGVKRVYRAIASNSIPGVLRLNRRRYALSRAAVEAGHRELMERADKITDPEWRRSYLENVAEHRAVVEMWEELHRQRDARKQR